MGKVHEVEVKLVWTKNSKAVVVIKGNAAGRFPEKDLKQVLWETGSGRKRRKSLI
jgi:hypothetical protein